MSVYLDFNATTPLDQAVIEKISTALLEYWGNPSSRHALGKLAKKEINYARENIAALINSDPESIIFTSGGTEANNMVIMGVVNRYKEWIKSQPDGVPVPHVITSNVEHDSVAFPLRHLKSKGEIDLTVVSVSSHDPDSLVAEILANIKNNTCLVTVMLANNEIGAIMPVSLIGRKLSDVNKQRKTEKHFPVLLHSDAAQAVGKIYVDVKDMQVDFLSIAGHKFYGPRIGCLYIKNLLKENYLEPLLFGGGQECGYRPGTENTPMIVGLGEAARLVQENIDGYYKHMSEMKNYLESKLQSVFGSENLVFNSNSINFKTLPNTCSVSFVGDDLDGSSILENCKHVIASVGAACHSQKGISQNLLAFGIPSKVARSTVRLSVGRETTTSDIDKAVYDLHKAVSSLNH